MAPPATREPRPEAFRATFEVRVATADRTGRAHPVLSAPGHPEGPAPVGAAPPGAQGVPARERGRGVAYWRLW